MEVLLTNSECEQLFLDAMCNGLGFIQGYGLDVCFNRDEYKEAKQTLVESNRNTCYEDVLLQMLKEGKPILVIDTENEESTEINIGMIYERMPRVPLENLTNMIRQNDDATDADIILQTIFFDEVIFG